MEISLEALQRAYLHFGYVRAATPDMIEFTGERFFHSPVEDEIGYDVAHILHDIAQYNEPFAEQIGEYLLSHNQQEPNPPNPAI